MAHDVTSPGRVASAAMISSSRRLLALTAVLTAVFVLTAWRLGDLGPDELPRDLTLLALNTLPLLLLRRNPLVVLLVFSVAYPWWLFLDHEPHLLESLPAFAAMYAVGGWDRPFRVRVFGLLAPAWMMAAAAFWRAPESKIGYVAVMFVVVWALGAVIASRQSYAEQLEARTAALQEARRELADRAVADERARIARELHDVIAHAMSVITVRAGVGAHLLDSRPAEAAAALRVIESTGREALSEMRRMLAVLRDPDPRAPLPEPQPGLRDIARLIEQARESGLPVTLTTEGEPRPSSAGLELAGYRLVQEAVTNVVKHAPGACASVTIRYLAGWLEIEVRNAGGPFDGTVVPGQGLRGMAERVALYDGRLEITAGGDEFRVTARLPAASAEPDHLALPATPAEPDHQTLPAMPAEPDHQTLPAEAQP
jgi:signal transduction histidine kinase